MAALVFDERCERAAASFDIALRLLERAGGNDGIELPAAEEHRLSRDREGRHGTVVDRETAGDHDKPGIGARAVEQERRGHCSAVAEPAEPGKAAARIGCDPVPDLGGLMRKTLRHRGSGAGIEEPGERSEEHTSELQSLMRISYAVFCLKKKRSKSNDAH